MSYNPAIPPQQGIMTPYGLSPGNPGATWGYSPEAATAAEQAQLIAMGIMPRDTSQVFMPDGTRATAVSEPVASGGIFAGGSFPWGSLLLLAGLFYVVSRGGRF
jgi:hypothetical protein